MTGFDDDYVYLIEFADVYDDQADKCSSCGRLENGVDVIISDKSGPPYGYICDWCKEVLGDTNNQIEHSCIAELAMKNLVVFNITESDAQRHLVMIAYGKLFVGIQGDPTVAQVHTKLLELINEHVSSVPYHMKLGYMEYLKNDGLDRFTQSCAYAKNRLNKNDVFDSVIDHYINRLNVANLNPGVQSIMDSYTNDGMMVWMFKRIASRATNGLSSSVNQIIDDITETLDDMGCKKLTILKRLENRIRQRWNEHVIRNYVKDVFYQTTHNLLKTRTGIPSVFDMKIGQSNDKKEAIRELLIAMAVFRSSEYEPHVTDQDIRRLLHDMLPAFTSIINELTFDVSQNEVRTVAKEIDRTYFSKMGSHALLALKRYIGSSEIRLNQEFTLSAKWLMKFFNGNNIAQAIIVQRQAFIEHLNIVSTIVIKSNPDLNKTRIVDDLLWIQVRQCHKDVFQHIRTTLANMPDYEFEIPVVNDSENQTQIKKLLISIKRRMGLNSTRKHFLQFLYLREPNYITGKPSRGIVKKAPEWFTDFLDWTENPNDNAYWRGDLLKRMETDRVIVTSKSFLTLTLDINKWIPTNLRPLLFKKYRMDELAKLLADNGFVVTDWTRPAKGNIIDGSIRKYSIYNHEFEESLYHFELELIKESEVYTEEYYYDVCYFKR